MRIYKSLLVTLRNACSLRILNIFYFRLGFDKMNIQSLVRVTLGSSTGSFDLVGCCSVSKTLFILRSLWIWGKLSSSFSTSCPISIGGVFFLKHPFSLHSKNCFISWNSPRQQLTRIKIKRSKIMGKRIQRITIPAINYFL